MDKICIVGMGYIGLPTALMMAANGKSIIGVDINSDLILELNNGKISFEEKGLQDIFEIAMKAGIKFETKYPSANIYIIAVPTPFNKKTKKINPDYVVRALNSCLDVAEKESIFIIESTIAPGTIDKFIRPAIEKRGFCIGKDIHIAHAPERIIPGNMINELIYNSRVVGVDSEIIGERIKQIYKSFCKSEIIITSIRNAEMCKVVENSYRDVNIAFANELAKICRQDNLDVYEIIKIANMHPRVNILNPGPGVGGHCISVDPWFLVGDYPNISLLIHEARKINDSMPAFVLERIKDILKENNMTIKSKIGFYGIAYKENVDDTRESPTLQLYNHLELHLSQSSIFFDPFCKNIILNGQINNFEQFASECDLIVIMVGHDHILENFDIIKNKIILDTKNIIKKPGIYKL